MKNDSVKKYLPIVIVGVMLVLLNVFAVVWYFIPAGPDQLHEDVVPGKVVSVTKDTLVTMDPRGRQKEFVVNDTTQFFSGRNAVTIDTLDPGSIVLVELDLATTTPLVAREVRVMTDKRKGKKLP